MKRAYLSIFTIAAIAVGCSNEGDYTSPLGEADIVTLTTRADSDYIDGAEMVVENLTDVPSYVENPITTSLYTFNGSVWSSETPLKWYGDGDITLNSYIKMDGAESALVTISEGESVDQSSTENLAAYDFQYGYSVVESGDINLDIELEHIMAKVVFNLTVISNETTQLELSSPMSMSRDGSEWSADSNYTTVSACSNDNATQFTAYVVPNTWVAPKVILSYGDGTELVAQSDESFIFEGGKEYKVKIFVNSDESTATFASNFTVAEWGESDAIESTSVSVVWDGESIATGFGGGTGVETDPYTITTPAELAYLADLVNNPESTGNQQTYTYFRLDANLDLNNHEWTPIGQSSTNSFAGTFDGNGKVISNLKITSESTSYFIGLFGAMNCQAGRVATVKDLTLKDVTLSAVTNLGAIVGYAQNRTEIENCKVEGGTISVGNTTSKPMLGGIIGLAGTVDNKISNCEVLSVEFNAEMATAGGIFGKINADNSVIACQCGDSTIDGREVIGGIGGLSSGSVVGCSSIVDITNSLKTGVGTMGGVLGNNSGTMTNCYSIPTLSYGWRMAALVGTNKSYTITNSFTTNTDQNAVGDSQPNLNDSARVSDIPSVINDLNIDLDEWEYVVPTESSIYPLVIIEKPE